MNRFYSSVTINFTFCLDFHLLEMLGVRFELMLIGSAS
jgi:hypothetical protein